MEENEARIRHEKENEQLAYPTEKWGTKHQRKIQMIY